MPYSTAAICLHMPAESGQLHERWISAGEGNRPWLCRQIRSMTPLDNRPCSNSTSESIAPAQSSQMDFHCAFLTGATFSAALCNSRAADVGMDLAGGNLQVDHGPVAHIGPPARQPVGIIAVPLEVLAPGRAPERLGDGAAFDADRS